MTAVALQSCSPCCTRGTTPQPSYRFQEHTSCNFFLFPVAKYIVVGTGTPDGCISPVMPLLLAARWVECLGFDLSTCAGLVTICLEEKPRGSQSHCIHNFKWRLQP